MPVIAAFFAYLLGCMLLSAALLPWLYPFFEAWIGASPDRSLYRFGMLLALLGLPFLLRALGLRGRDLLGFAPDAAGWKRALLKGLLGGILILSGLILLLLLFGARDISLRDQLDLLTILKWTLGGLASGLAVGLIEEFFFRGPMHSGARKTLGFWATALLTGTFYSMVHFMRPIAPEGTIDIAEAMHMLFGGMAQLADFAQHGDRFVALLIAGMFLSMVRERTGNILWAIGIHAGWVLIIKVSKKLTATQPDAALAWLVGGDGITGWLSTVWMAAIALIYWWWSDPQRRARG